MQPSPIVGHCRLSSQRSDQVVAEHRGPRMSRLGVVCVPLVPTVSVQDWARGIETHIPERVAWL
jgi:hypothetical protein